VLSLFTLFILILNRGIIGKQGTYLLDSYFVTTWCLAAVLCLVLRSHGHDQMEVSEPMIIPLPTLRTSERKAA
jgi:hypothetical protein